MMTGVGLGMQRSNRMLARTAAMVALGAFLAGCSSDISMEDLNFARRTRNFINSQALSFSAPSQDFSIPPVTQADLVGPQGQCAPPANAAPTSAQLEADSQNGSPEPVLVQGGIALQMTECQVVNRAGAPDNIEFGTNERGERTVVLTYLHGSRPGIYRFAAGRLVSIERAPETEKPRAPTKKRRHRA
jgi:hypothetical protein